MRKLAFPLLTALFRNSIRVALVVALAVLFVGVAYAIHSWGNYHWARQSNPFTVKLGDNVSSVWDPYLGTTSSDWSISSVLDTTIVTGGTDPRKCRPTSGRVEVCAAKYGFSGWLGLAQIWVSGDHITKAITKLNDTYFNTTKYNTPGWRSLVMCQEVGHAFGLAHQDEVFGNTNLGTCMDYTDDPDGTLKGQLSNEHPNLHDYDQLETIYIHFDSVTTLSQSLSGAARGRNNGDLGYSVEWGRGLRKDGRGRTSLYELDLGGGKKVFTFVFWAD